ncbi:MAG: potassium-transporting ATPase subunit KdpC [Phycisphaerae bacterium]|nr:potassium-transporting ATPase subunit KdpC [Phycisphaerae bacterium]
MWKQLRPAVVILLVMTFLTGVLYPLLVTGVAQVFFSHQANGSVIFRDGEAVGSQHIGQPFDEPKYFWGRLSATSGGPYNASASGGSNFGPRNPGLIDAAEARLAALRQADPDNAAPVSVDLVTASGSGLDPDISVAAALYQTPRVARARGVDVAVIRGLIHQHTQGRQWGVLGEKRVNVLQLNLALDDMKP